MSDIRGRFYFKLSINGNLAGEYSHQDSKHSWVETAQRTSPAACGFEGDYRSAWIQENEEVCSAELKITRKAGSTGIFSLVWTPPGETAQFEGEAMLCDQILIGNYRSV